MTVPHSSYEDLAARRRGSADYRDGYAEARRAYLIGQAVRECRLALGLSQTELASRAGMPAALHGWKQVESCIIPLLERISMALDADLIVEIAPHAAGPALRPKTRIGYIVSCRIADVADLA